MAVRLLVFTLWLAALLAAAAHDDLLALVEGRHWKRARAIVEQRLPTAGNDARLCWLASRVRTAYSELDEAARLGENAARLDPENADYQFQLAEVYGTQAQQASILRQPMLGRRCKKAMDRAVALNSGHTHALLVQMLYYYQAPSFIGGDKNKARQYPAIIRKFDAAEGWLAEARLADLEKQPDRLEVAYRNAVQANPRHYPARIAAARHSISRRDFAAAEEHARAASDLHPDRSAPYHVLALAAAARRDLARLESVVAEALKNSPDNRDYLVAAAGDLTVAKRNLDRAESYLQRYLEVDPEPGAPTHAEARWRLAQVHEAQGDMVRARAEIDAAAKLDPRHAGIRADRQRLASGKSGT